MIDDARMKLIQQIKAEMERRIKSWQTRGEHSPEGQGKDTCVSRVTELTDLLSFLDTLQEQPVCEETVYTLNGLMQQFIKEGENDAEQERRQGAYNAFFDAMDYEPEPVCKDLEEELKLYCKQYYNYDYPEQEYYDSSPMMPHIIASAHHFYELGRQSKPKVCEGLYDFMKKRSESLYFHDDFEIASYKKGVVDGAKWQKEQDDKELSEKIASAYQLGLADKEKKMMKEAVEGIVMNFSSNEPKPTVIVDAKGFNQGDRVRVIVCKKED